MRKEQTSATYDEMFSEGGYAGVYDLAYHRSPYFPMYREVLQELRRLGCRSVLEVGCGTGAFAHMLGERVPGLRYEGFDFSSTAVDRAGRRTGHPEWFRQADATDPSAYVTSAPVDGYVCTEVLEHLEADVPVVDSWPPGMRFVCSVPNYDSVYHARHFRSESEVEARYGHLLRIERIQRVRKPVLDDLALSNRLKHLRWNRWRPRRLLDLIGRGDFNRVGGWFVFSGRRR